MNEDTWQQVVDVLDARKRAWNFHQPGTGGGEAVVSDMMTAVPTRRDESTEAFHARCDAHRAEVLARRVEFVWRT